MRWKVLLLLCLASLLIGMILVLSIVWLPWMLLVFPYVWAIWWITGEAYAKAREESILLRKHSWFQIEVRNSFERRPNGTWEPLGDRIHTLKQADQTLEILKRSYRPTFDILDGAITSQEWRVVQTITGEEIYDRCQADLPRTPEARLQSAMERLDTLLDK